MPHRMVSAAPVRAITVTEGCTMTLLDPVCRELLDAIGAALDVGDRPKDPQQALAWQDQGLDRARMVSALIETLLAYDQDQTGRARLITRELRQATRQR
jgi:hypothetical protein